MIRPTTYLKPAMMVKRIETPWAEAKTITHEAYVDGVLIDTHGMDLDRESAMKLAAGDGP